MKTLWRNLSPIALGVAMTALLSPAHAAQRIVGSRADDGPGSLRQTVRAAAAGDTIIFGVRGDIQLTSGDIALNKNLTITGPGAVSLRIIGSNSRLFRVARGVTVNVAGLTLIGSLNGTAGTTDETEAVSGENGTDGGDGQSVSGGIFFNEGTLKVQQCALTGAASAGQGGAGSQGGQESEWHGDGGNGGQALGGAIYSRGLLTLDTCTLFGNRVQGGRGGDGGSESVPGVAGGNGGNGGSAYGGALFNAGTADVINCTFIFNSAGGAATGEPGRGGAFNSPDNGLPGTNGMAMGGAMANVGRLRIKSTTISQNNAGGANSVLDVPPGSAVGGGIASVSGDNFLYPILTLSNTIVAGNRLNGESNYNEPDVSGDLFSFGHNLIGIRSGFGFGPRPTDKLGSPQRPLDAKLGRLTYNGGQLQTMEPLPDSPAIDAGLSQDVPRDQRGVARPIDVPGVPNAAGSDGSDIGAIEYRAPAPTTYEVNTLDDHEDGACTPADCTLRDALSVALRQVGEDKITFKAGLSGTLALRKGEIGVLSPVSIIGPGRDVLKIDAHNDSRIFYCEAPQITIKGLNLVRGFDRLSGGAILGGELTLEDCALSNNRAVYLGGAIAVGGSRLRVINTTFRSNRAGDGAAIGASFGFTSVENCFFRDNIADDQGGAIASTFGGSPQITDSQFVNNKAQNGGAVYSQSGLQLQNSIFQQNTASRSGGAVSASGGNSLFGNSTITNCRFDQNKALGAQDAAPQGGALAYYSSPDTSPLRIENSTFDYNIATQGAAIFNEGSLQMKSCSISRSFSGEGEGAGLYNRAQAILENCVFSGNEGAGGAGVNNVSSAARLTAKRCVFRDSRGQRGGGVRNEGIFSAELCSFLYNMAGNGGGVLNVLKGRTSLLNCFLMGNRARQSGAGAYNERESTLSMRNCTVADNHNAEANSIQGAGIFNDGGLLLNHCTITRNSAGHSGGGVKNTYRATITNTIIADNDAPQSPDVSGVFMSQGFNLIGIADGSSGFTSSGDKTGTIAAPLGAGLIGSTVGGRMHYVPRAGSPALDAGTVAGLPRDALNRPRPKDLPDVSNSPGSDGSDIGAIEAETVIPPPPPG